MKVKKAEGAKEPIAKESVAKQSVVKEPVASLTRAQCAGHGVNLAIRTAVLV
ncbi:hypothetical protein ACFIOY_25330 [Bradyrhizobium sp. TZ2]